LITLSSLTMLEKQNCLMINVRIQQELDSSEIKQ
jgi:hypothetical protein